MSQTMNVNMTPAPYQQSGVLNCSQYDVGRTILIKLLDEGGAYTIPTGATVKLMATKPSGLGFTETCTWSGNTVTVTTTATMTAEGGKFPAELQITKSGIILGSANFLMKVEKSPHPTNTTDGTADELVNEITALVERAESAAETAAEDAAEAAAAEINELMDYLPDEVEDLKSAFNENNYVFDITSGEYVDIYDNGAIKSYSSFSRTGYIPTDGFGTELHINSGGASVYNAFYDSSKNYVSKFSLVSGENKIIIPSTAAYFVISETTAYLEDTIIKNQNWTAINDKLNSVVEPAVNLLNIADVQIGKNWTGGTALNRAIIVIDCTGSTDYYFYVPPSTAFHDVSIVEKATESGNALSSASFSNNSEQIITTNANAKLLYVQFNGNSDISITDFNNYNIYMCENDKRYTAVDNVARAKAKKKYIFIGDSYCEGYNPDGNTTGWGARLKTAMGLSDAECTIKYKGGTGFYHTSDSKTFSTLLDEAGAEVDKTTVTDIVVCGGYNDNSETLTNVYNAVLSFISKVRTDYPNAKLYIGMIGASNNATVKTNLQNTVLYSYQYGALANVCNYLNNVEYALSVSNLASDGVHPNGDGQVQITIAIKQALETGSAYIPYRFFNQIKTS